MDERPLTEEEFAAIDGDPRREAGYYSGRARYFRLRAARYRDRLRRGLNNDDDAPFDADAYDRLSETLNKWAEWSMTKVPSPDTPSPSG